MPPDQTPKNNPYDFINNPATVAKASPLSKFALPGGDSKLKRIVVVVVGVVLLIIVISIFYSIISNSGKGGVDDLSAVAQRQSELNNLGVAGEQNSSSQAVKNMSLTTEATMVSAQQQFISLIAKQGIKLTPQQTSLNDSSVSAQLATATQNGDYDTVFVQVIQNQLTLYGNALQKAYDATTSTSRKTLLSNDYNQVKLLQNEANQTANNLS